MIQIADDDKALSCAQANQLPSDVSGFADVLVVEHGDVLRNRAARRDRTLRLRRRPEPADLLRHRPARRGDHPEMGPLRAPRCVLIPDPNTTEPDSFGSYVVYRSSSRTCCISRHASATLPMRWDWSGPTDRGPERWPSGGSRTARRWRCRRPVDSYRIRRTTFNMTSNPRREVPVPRDIRRRNPRGDIVRQFGAPEEAASGPVGSRRGMPYGTGGPAERPPIVAGSPLDRRRPAVRMLPGEHCEPVRLHAAVVGRRGVVPGRWHGRRPGHRAGSRRRPRCRSRSNGRNSGVRRGT